jgi:hypothetical protein
MLRAGGLTQEVRADQLVQPGNPGHSLGQPRPCQHPARLVLHLHVMMIFSPIVTDEQHPASSLDTVTNSRQRKENTSGLMDQCSPGTTPHQRFRPPHDQRGTVLT